MIYPKTCLLPHKMLVHVEWFMEEAILCSANGSVTKLEPENFSNQESYPQPIFLKKKKKSYQHAL